MKVDLLAFGAHPDDVELACSGTLAKHKSMGKTTGIIDLTRGELGTRGTAESRDKEAAAAAKILQVDIRENLAFRDGFFLNDEKHQLEVIKIIRKYRPALVLTNAPEDRHPDHGKGCKLVTDACFLSGLAKVKTQENGKEQEAWRPKTVLHYIQDRYLKPDILVDISGFFELRMQSILAYESQFYNSKSTEAGTYISSPAFLESLKSRPAEFGRLMGVDYAEGFLFTRLMGVNDLNDLI